eukprot:16442967-Heterocapsa_arctica.AAC.1
MGERIGEASRPGPKRMSGRRAKGTRTPGQHGWISLNPGSFGRCVCFGISLSGSALGGLSGTWFGKTKAGWPWKDLMSREEMSFDQAKWVSTPSEQGSNSRAE